MADIQMYSPQEIMGNYADLGAKKAGKPTDKLLLLSILAGLIIGAGAMSSNTVTHDIANPSVARLISGLIFPFGLGMVMLSGAELFTGNTMIITSVMEGKAKLAGMFRNWVLVYFGNFIGAGLLAAGCAFYGQLNHGSGHLAVYTMKVAATKCSITFGYGIVQGILCNLLVCLAVLISLAGKDAVGRVVGAYIPIVFFVIGGFEHCVANMYYITAGLLAKTVPAYAELALEAGIHTESLTWGNFLLNNMVPVTIGNIIGGLAMGLLMWYCHLKGHSHPVAAKKEQNVTTNI